MKSIYSAPEKKHAGGASALCGSFTIEAAVIVPLSMFIIISFIYMAFYIHDIAVIGSTGSDYILENAVSYKDSQAQIEEDTKAALEERLIIAADVSVNVYEDNGIVLESSADFSLPLGVIGEITGSSFECVNTSVNISMLNARGTLLKYKAVSDGIDILTGDE